VGSQVLADKEWACMVAIEGARWCTGCAATGRNCWVEQAVLANREIAQIETLYRAN